MQSALLSANEGSSRLTQKVLEGSLSRAGKVSPSISGEKEPRSGLASTKARRSGKNNNFRVEDKRKEELSLADTKDRKIAIS